MSKQIHVISARTFAVTLGDLTFYASGWKLTAERNFAEQGGATGGSFITNSCRRAKRLTLDGYLPFHTSPAEVVLALESAVAQQSRFVFSLRGMRFLTAMITSYTVQETAVSGVLPCQLTLITTSSIGPVTSVDLETGTDSAGTSSDTETGENT